MEPLEAYNCSVCNISCNSTITLEQHYKSSGHQNKMKATRLPLITADKTGDGTPPVSGDESANAVATGNGATGFSIVQEELDYCSICDISFNHPLPAKEHYQGAKHLAKKMKLQHSQEEGAQFVSDCKLCNKIFDGQAQAEAHFASKRHLHKVEASNRPPKPGFIGECTLCNKVFPSEIQSKSHYESKKHLDKVEAANKPPGEVENFGECTLCNKKFPSENQSKSHYESKKHLDKLKGNDEKKEPFGECTLCAKVFPFEMHATAHYSSKKHLQKVRAKEIKEGKVVEDAEVDGTNGTAAGDLFGKCDLCQKKFPGEAQAASHYASKKHIQKMELEKLRQSEKDAADQNEAQGETPPDKTTSISEADLKAMDLPAIDKLVSTTMNCPFCKKTFSGYAPVRDHISSKKHVARVNAIKANPDLSIGSAAASTTNALGSVCEDISIDECGPSEEQMVFGEILDECILADVVNNTLNEMEHKPVVSGNEQLMAENSDHSSKTRKRNMPADGEPPVVPVRQSKRRNCK